MLGTRKVKLSNYKDSAEQMMVNFFQITDSARYVAEKRAGEIFATKGANRYNLIDGRGEDVSLREDIGDYVNPDLSSPFVKQICRIISEFTSEFKRRCLVGFFMMNGTTMRFPEDFKLLTDTEDPQRNVENERLNDLIIKFNDLQDTKMKEAIDKLENYLKSLPAPIYQHYLERYEGFFSPENETGNIYRDYDRAYRSAGLPIVPEDKEEFKKVVLEYREERIRYAKPGPERVCAFLYLDKYQFKKTYTDALPPIISVIPDKLIARELVDGE